MSVSKNSFEGKSAIVTGGSRGIGFAIARALAAENARVAIVAKNEKRGQEAADTVNKEGGKAEFYSADITRRDRVEEVVAQVEERSGAVDILVNNAGIHDKAAFWEESEELWMRLYNVNVVGTVLISQAAVKRMKERGGGSIIHISSKAAVVGEPGHVAYSASKGAVLSMTRSMAIELAPFGIRVNAVCPGPIVTDLLVENLPTTEEQQSLAAEVPLERLGRPEDIAGVVAYLASDESGWCTGQSFSIDGGMSVLK